MDEAAEGKRLRRLAKDYSKGLLSGDAYRQERASVIEAFNRNVLEGVASSAPLDQKVPPGSGDSVDADVLEEGRKKPSVISSLFLCLCAFAGGLLLGYLVLQLSLQ